MEKLWMLLVVPGVLVVGSVLYTLGSAGLWLLQQLGGVCLGCS